MKTIKRICTLLLAVMLIASFTVIAFAEDNNEDNVLITGPIDTNTGVNVIISENGSVEGNIGSVRENNGTIWDNGGTVDTNNGTISGNNGIVNINYDTIENNNDSGTVTTNRGIISKNNGNVYENADTVVNNNDGGAVNGNFGTIGAYTDDGKVDKTQGNFGTVSGNYLGANAGLTSNGNIIYNGSTGVIGDGEGYSHWELGNFSTVDINDGIIVTNGSGGEVKTNNGIITTNKGTVTENKSIGTIETNAKDGVVTTNTGKVETNQAGGTVTTNNGRITTNNGTVNTNNDNGDISIMTNNGTVTNNNGAIDENSSTGTVTNNNDGSNISTNKGTVENNNSGAYIKYNNNLVTNNDGRIDQNSEGATVENNSKTVDRNIGTVVNNSGSVYIVTDGTTSGTVQNNSGTVLAYDASSVTNNFNDGSDTYKGTVTLWGGQTDLTDQVAHQFHNYAEITTDGCEGTFSTSGAVTEYDGKYWVEADTESATPATKTGSVTVTPETGYSFDTPVIDKTEYVNVTGDKKGWTFNFVNLLEHIKISITSTKDPDPKPEPKPTAGPVAAQIKLTFELDGGTIDGKSEYSKTYSYGQHIKLPIPEKEGYTFGGWETTVRGKTVTYEGGARYTVTAAKTFTAIWIEN